MTATPSYTTTQVMMTLSGLAAFAPDPYPSGEALANHRNRIVTAINTQLATGRLAAGKNWKVMWLGLTPNRANLAYIAYSPQDAMVALVLRGTIGGSPIDSAEDLDVGTLLPFADGGVGNISQGAMEAFTGIVNVVDPVTGVPLVKALQNQLAGQSLALYVTGHSLGGAMATTLGLYLACQQWPAEPQSINVYTFAAPTAGDDLFATSFDTMFPTAGNPKRSYVGTWNQWDVVPNAWWNLVPAQGHPNPVQSFFPPPGPKKTAEVDALIAQMYKKANNNKYTQPALAAPLNKDYALYYDTQGNDSLDCWLAELAFQHANDTYLQLLLNAQGQSAPTINALAPTVARVTPAASPYAGKPGVEIAGTNFTPDCVVDFGVWRAAPPKLISPTQLVVDAPPGAGIVNVTVSNIYGTSATTLPADCYASPAPPSTFCQFKYLPTS